MKRARKEGTPLEMVSGGGETRVRESHPVCQKCQDPRGWTGPSISCYWQNCLCELGLRTKVRNKAAHTGSHVRWEHLLFQKLTLSRDR